jgi:hypothetical protein
MSEPRFCKDCRYQDPGIGPTEAFFWKCLHPAMALPPKVDLLTGELSEQPTERCSSARIFSELCGKEGRYWEPRGFV